MLDPQMKRGLLDICVLSVLNREDSYGYRIVRELSQCIEVSESTLYPILRRLEASGFLTEYAVAHNGRLRKFYRITAAGSAHLQSFLESRWELERIYDFIEGGTSGHDQS